VLTDNERRFLLSLVKIEPQWSLIATHLAQMPAIRWKMENLEKLRKRNPAKFRLQADELRRRFEA
jgi:hypothetical protein